LAALTKRGHAAALGPNCNSTRVIERRTAPLRQLATLGGGLPTRISLVRDGEIHDDVSVDARCVPWAKRRRDGAPRRARRRAMPGLRA
jgi:hypothetical protein